MVTRRMATTTNNGAAPQNQVKVFPMQRPLNEQQPEFVLYCSVTALGPVLEWRAWKK